MKRFISKTTAVLLVLLGSSTAIDASVFRYDQSPGTTTGWVTAVHIPADLPEVRGLIIVGNGSGADETGAVNDPELVAFARSIGFGVMGLGRWSNLYSNTERSRFLAALASFASQAGRPELVNVPWVAFGFSLGGGQAYSLNYHFPSRTIAIGVNKAGFSFLSDGSDVGRLDQSFESRPASQQALLTPALLVAGQNDDAGRLTNLSSAYANNRAVGAPWAWLIEENAGHEKGVVYRWFLPFFEEIIHLRYPSPMSAKSAQPVLNSINQQTGWLIHQQSQTTGQLSVEAQAGSAVDPLSRGWVPSQKIARLAQAFGSFSKAGMFSAQTTVASPLAAPASLTYSANLTNSPGWTRIEFFDGTGKLGEVTPGAAPTWTRSVQTSTGFFSTYGLVTRADSSLRYTPLQTLWVNGSSGFSIVPGAPEAVWTFRSTIDNTGNISGSWSQGTNWNTGAVPGGQNLRADLSAIDFGSYSEISLDGARTAGYLQFGDSVGGQWTALRPGTGGSLTMNVTSGAAVIQLASGAGQTLHFNGVSPIGSSPLEMIGNGSPSQSNNVIMALASGYTGPILLRNAIEWSVPSTTSFGNSAQGTIVQAGSVLNFREWMGTGVIAEPISLAGFGGGGRPALRIGAAANATVTLNGNLTLTGPASLGTAATTGNGVTLVLGGRIVPTGSDRSLYLGFLRSQPADATLPSWGLDTTALDDVTGATHWGSVVIGANATFDAPLERVVQGLGTLRLEGASNRLPSATRLILNAAAPSAASVLNTSRVVLSGISQELTGLDSQFGNSTTTRIQVVGGNSTPATLIINAETPSTFAGSLGGNGTHENQLILEKRGVSDLELSGNLSYTGGSRVAGGRLVLGATTSLPASGHLNIESGASVRALRDFVFPATAVLRRSSGETAAVRAEGRVVLVGQIDVELVGAALSPGSVIPLISAETISGSLSALRLPPRRLSGAALRFTTDSGEIRVAVDATTFDAALYRAGILSATAPVTPDLFTSDPDGDGVGNALEYALGSDPSSAQASPVRSGISSGGFQIEFPRDTRTRDIRIEVEAASDLKGPWATIARSDRSSAWTGEAQVLESPPDAMGLSMVRVTDRYSTSPRFLRLRILFLP